MSKALNFAVNVIGVARKRKTGPPLAVRLDPSSDDLIRAHARELDRTITDELRAALELHALGIVVARAFQPDVMAQLGERGAEVLLDHLLTDLAAAAAEALPDAVPIADLLDPNRLDVNN
jgi:hypothetical protein